MQVRQDSIVRWLRPRSAAVRSLRLRGSAEQDGALVPNLSADVMMQRAAAMMDPPPRIHDFATCAKRTHWAALVMPLLSCTPVLKITLKILGIFFLLHEPAWSTVVMYQLHALL